MNVNVRFKLLVALIALVSSSMALVPRNAIVTLAQVNELFPEITQESSVGANLTAVGNPKATISVIYRNSDDAKKVTITVDQYENALDASSAYSQAIEKSKLPGFTPLSIPFIGQQSFAGTITMNGETHIGLGVLEGSLIVGITLAGFDASPSNIANLVKIAQSEVEIAKKAHNTFR